MSDPSMTAEAWRAVTSDLIEWLRPRYSRHKIAVLEWLYRSAPGR